MYVERSIFDFIDKFVTTAEKLFPRLYLHWEDFGRSTAATILEKYQNRITTFNDDVQGTGIVALAGILGALEISKEKFTDQRVMIFGAGTAGVGIATQIFEEFKQQGLSEAEARSHIYLIDKQGLLFEDTEGLTDGQKRFVRQRDEFENADSLKDLYNSVKNYTPISTYWYIYNTGYVQRTGSKRDGISGETSNYIPIVKSYRVG